MLSFIKTSRQEEPTSTTDLSSTAKPQNSTFQRALIQSLKSNYIFWFNRCLKMLFSEMGDLCPIITQKQISRGINHQIAEILETIHRNEKPNLELLSTRKSRELSYPYSSTLSQVNTEQFSALLHFNIRLTRLLELEQLTINHNPLGAHVCFNLFHQNLNNTVINQKDQQTLHLRFADILADQFDTLTKESNTLLNKAAATVKLANEALDEQEILEGGDNNNCGMNGCDGCDSNRDDIETPHSELRAQREEMAAQQGIKTEEAMECAHEAVTGILSNHLIDSKIHPLIQGWEKYLFKLYLNEGGTSQSWSRALRTVVSIRRYATTTQEQIKPNGKQQYLAGLGDLIKDCKRGLEEVLIQPEQIETLVAPLEDHALSNLYGIEQSSALMQYT